MASSVCVSVSSARAVFAQQNWEMNMLVNTEGSKTTLTIGQKDGATELADGLIMSDVTLDRMGECISTIEQSLKDNNRNRNDFSISNLFAWHIKTDKEESKAEARSKLFVRGMLDHWYISTFLDEDESRLVEDNFQSFAHAYANNTDIIENVPDSIVEKLLDNLAFAGDRNDVEKMVEELLEFKRNGLDEFAIRLYKDPKDSMELIAETVVPHLD